MSNGSLFCWSVALDSPATWDCAGGGAAALDAAALLAGAALGSELATTVTPLPAADVVLAPTNPAVVRVAELIAATELLSAC